MVTVKTSMITLDIELHLQKRTFPEMTHIHKNFNTINSCENMVNLSYKCYNLLKKQSKAQMNLIIIQIGRFFQNIHKLSCN